MIMLTRSPFTFVIFYVNSYELIIYKKKFQGL